MLKICLKYFQIKKSITEKTTFRKLKKKYSLINFLFDIDDETIIQQRQDALQMPPCEVGYFECADGESCVKQQYNCDNFPDCPDGSDERNCSKWGFKKYVFPSNRT